MIKTVTLELPSHWACALINGDEPDSTIWDEIQATFAALGYKPGNTLNVSDDSYTGHFNGLMTEMASYTVAV